MAREIGERVSARRKSLGLTQRKAAEISGMNHITLHLIEHGRSNPTATTILSLSRSLGMTPHEILGWKEEP